MRWRFPSHAERAAQGPHLARMDAWWSAFAEMQGRIVDHFRGRGELDLPSWIRENLDPVDPRIMWEFSGDASGHTLALTPEGARELRPFADVLVARAPRLPGWRFTTYRPPADLDQASERTRQAPGAAALPSAISVTKGRDNLIDLTYDESDDISSGAAFTFIDGLLGEELLDHWIGVVEGGSTLEGGAASGRTVGPGLLLAAVNDLRREILEALPEQPAFATIADARWFSWSTNPDNPKSDFGRDDIITGMTSRPDVTQAASRAALFHSPRFSRHGETFCYVKSSVPEGLTQTRVKDRSRLSDAIDESLSAAKLGCVVGGATGLRHDYIDLAVLDLDRASRVVMEALGRVGAHERTWLLFFDADLKSEWLGLRDETPAPPSVPAPLSEPDETE
jgi:hypothetical protein